MIGRVEALELLQRYVENVNLQKHCLATAIVMESLAKRFNLDSEKWYVTGLLHDIDYMETADEPDKHSLKAAEILNDLGMPEDLIYAIKVHNEMHGFPRLSPLDKALYAVDPLTGLIVACALICPDRKLDPIDMEFVMKRFNERSFAKGANREQILSANELGLSLEQFIEISLNAMKSISKDLGL